MLSNRQNKNFITFILAFTVYSLNVWISFSALPLLISKKFSSGSMLLSSLSLQVIPRILLAPIIGKFLLKKGSQMVAWAAILGIGIVRFVLPAVENKFLFQGFIFVSGIFEMFVSVALLTLRSKLSLPGKRLMANSVFVTIERGSQVVGPALTGIIASLFSVSYCLKGGGVALLIASILIAKTQFYASDVENETIPLGEQIKTFFHTLFSKSALNAVIFPAFGAALSFGSLTPFLMWSTTQVFQLPEANWTYLTTAQGIGAVIGGIVATPLLSYVNKSISLKHIYIGGCITKLIGLLFIGLVSTYNYALTLMLIVGIFEMIVSVLFFTLIQKNLSNSIEVIFYTFFAPINYVFLISGIIFSSLYSSHIVELRTFWLLVSSVAIAITLVPLLIPSRGKHLNWKSV